MKHCAPKRLEEPRPIRHRSHRHVLDRLLDYHYNQGLSARLLSVDELFHPTILTTCKI